MQHNLLPATDCRQSFQSLSGLSVSGNDKNSIQNTRKLNSIPPGVRAFAGTLANRPLFAVPDTNSFPDADPRATLPAWQTQPRRPRTLPAASPQKTNEDPFLKKRKNESPQQQLPYRRCQPGSLFPKTKKRFPGEEDQCRANYQNRSRFLPRTPQTRRRAHPRFDIPLHPG